MSHDRNDRPSTSAPRPPGSADWSWEDPAGWRGAGDAPEPLPPGTDEPPDAVASGAAGLEALAGWLALGGEVGEPPPLAGLATTGLVFTQHLAVRPRHGPRSEPTDSGPAIDLTARTSADPALRWILAAIRLVGRDTPAARSLFRDLFEGCGNPRARLNRIQTLVAEGHSIDAMRAAWELKSLWTEELGCGERAYPMGREVYFAPDIPLSWEAAFAILEAFGEGDDAELTEAIQRCHARWRELWRARVHGLDHDETLQVMFAGWLPFALRTGRGVRREQRRMRGRG